MMKKKLLLAVPLVLALGCSAQQQSNENHGRRDRSASYDRDDQGFVCERDPDDPVGDEGARGLTGCTGEPGYAMAGPRGARGPTGRTETQGYQGATGDQGPVGRVDHWISYREFWFDTEMAEIRFSDTNKISQIASYMNENPSVQLGIDNSMDSRSSSSSQRLNNRRGDVIRDALVRAGVPSNRIDTGAFARVQSRRDGMVEVLIASRN